MDTNLVYAVTAVHHQQISSKRDTLLSLCKLSLKEGQPLENIVRIIEKAKAVCDFRNTVIHAYWSVDDAGTAHAVRFSARGEFKRTRNPYTSKQIQERADEAIEIGVELAELRDHLLGDSGKAHL